jgi:hypothetical protein
LAPQEPGGYAPDSMMFGTREGQGSLTNDQELLDRGARMVLRNLLTQIPALPSLAPEDMRPDPALDTFFFNPDPRGEFTPKDVENRDLLRLLEGMEGLPI